MRRVRCRHSAMLCPISLPAVATWMVGIGKQLHPSMVFSLETYIYNAGKLHGFGHIQFDSPEAVQRALALHG